MSLEILELAMCWEETFDVEIEGNQLQDLDTPARAIDFLADAVGASSEYGPCLSLRAYHHVRRTLLTSWPAVGRDDVMLDAKLTTLIGTRLRDWRRLFGILSLPSDWVLNWPVFGRGRVTIGHVVSRCVTEHGEELLPDGERWTRSQVRDVVHSSIRTIAGRVSFSDDESFTSMGF